MSEGAMTDTPPRYVPEHIQRLRAASVDLSGIATKLETQANRVFGVLPVEPGTPPVADALSQASPPVVDDLSFAFDRLAVEINRVRAAAERLDRIA